MRAPYAGSETMRVPASPGRLKVALHEVRGMLAKKNSVPGGTAESSLGSPDLLLLTADQGA
jgi:hypothetical protein